MTRGSDNTDQPDAVTPEMCARRILQTAPIIMRVLRQEMRSGAEDKLSVPQFRVLACLSGSPGASLTEVAEFVGVTGATASAMVDRLVRRGLVARANDPQERRRLRLDLTSDGACLLEQARAHTRGRVAERLTVLKRAELEAVVEGLDLLGRALGSAASPASEQAGTGSPRSRR